VRTAELPFDILFQGFDLLLLVGFLLDSCKVRKPNGRLGKDISGLSVALQTNMATTRNGMGQMQASTTTIILSQEQAEKILKAEAKSLKERFSYKINGLTSFPRVGRKCTLPVYVQGKETIIYNNKETVYYTPQGTLYTKGDSLVGVVSISDTIRIVVSKGKREQWWKIWNKRPLVTNAFMTHPDGSITSFNSVLSE